MLQKNKALVFGLLLTSVAVQSSYVIGMANEKILYNKLHVRYNLPSDGIKEISQGIASLRKSKEYTILPIGKQSAANKDIFNFYDTSDTSDKSDKLIQKMKPYGLNTDILKTIDKGFNKLKNTPTFEALLPEQKDDVHGTIYTCLSHDEAVAKYVATHK